MIKCFKKQGVFIMKKMVPFLSLIGLISYGANAAPSYLTRDTKGGYIVTYDYTDKAKSGWYMGARADLNLWNWENKYSVDADLTGLGSVDADKYSFEPVFGGSIFAGRTVSYFWRAELEAGYMGYFQDKDGESEFSMQIPYLMLNGYRDFINGIYIGAGLGIAMPITTMDLSPTLATTDGDNRKEYHFVPVAGIMVGYSYELDDNLVLDLRYRLSGMTGFDQRINMYDAGEASHWLQNDIDLILDNSISIGLRYEF